MMGKKKYIVIVLYLKDEKQKDCVCVFICFWYLMRIRWNNVSLSLYLTYLFLGLVHLEKNFNKIL